jgi:hypothetical protein
VRRLLVTASVVPSSPILVTLMKEALSSFETSVLTTARRGHSSHFILNPTLKMFHVFEVPVPVLWGTEREKIPGSDVTGECNTSIYNFLSHSS